MIMNAVQRHWTIAVIGFFVGAIGMLFLTGCAEKRQMDWGAVAKAYEQTRTP